MVKTKKVGDQKEGENIKWKVKTINRAKLETKEERRRKHRKEGLN